MKMKMKMMLRKSLMALLFVTVLAPVVLYTDSFAMFYSLSADEVVSEPSTPDNVIRSILRPDGERSRKSRHLNEESKGGDTIVELEDDNPFKQVTHEWHETNDGDNKLASAENMENLKLRSTEHTLLGIEAETKQEAQKVGKREPENTQIKNSDEHDLEDFRVRYLKDQLIRARLYLSFSATRNNAHFIRELRLRMKEVQKALGDATTDADLPKNAYDKLKAMDQTLIKGKHLQNDCTAIVKKLRAIIHSTEEQLRANRKQALFLTHLTAKTISKGLHCLPLRLSTEYYSLNSSAQQFQNQENLDDPNLFHYALFSDNVLATAVVVNSTVTNARDPSKHVFHIVTDKLNYAAMRMWFLANPPATATIQVQNIDEFTWLNES
ncbi:hypothetical protein R6Q59_001785 [Mikania micrantha]